MIYFVQAALIGRIKIGYCRRGGLDKRIATLQTASPVPLTLLATVSGTREREAALHARFAECRAHGEWFDPALRLVSFIARLQGRILTPRKVRVKRSQSAADWLRARFQERDVWKSSELFAIAHQDGISRDAIFEARGSLGLPRPRRQKGPDGSPAYYWALPTPGAPGISTGAAMPTVATVAPVLAAQGLAEIPCHRCVPRLPQVNGASSAPGATRAEPPPDPRL